MESKSAMSDDYLPVIESTGFMRPNLSSELTELLHRLDLSPSILLEEDALAIEKNSLYSSGPGSISNADIECGYPEVLFKLDTIDRKELLEEFSALGVRNNKLMDENNLMHLQLVKYFQKKQMNTVYGEPNEADALKHKYEKKLSQYKQLIEEVQAGEQNFKEEMNLMKEDLGKKLDEAGDALEVLVSKERAAGAQAYVNGRSLASNEIEGLITRKLAKIKDIVKIRIRYAHLRDNLAEKEAVLNALNIFTPNLDQKDYERLQAENLYYKHKLSMKKQEMNSRAKDQDRILRRLKAIKRKGNDYIRILRRRQDIHKEVKLRIAAIFRQKRIRRRNVEIAKNFLDQIVPVLGSQMCSEVLAKMNDVRNQNKEWLEKVKTIMKEIQETELRLQAIESQKTSHELTETTDDKDTDESISFRQISRRPPLGGGFLQAL